MLIHKGYALGINTAVWNVMFLFLILACLYFLFSPRHLTLILLQNFVLKIYVKVYIHI